MSEAFPESIGPYLPLRLLGRGGMGEVYHCVDPRGVEVAVKWLHKLGPSSRRRFDIEMRGMKQVDHPRLLSLLDNGEHRGRPYAVVEYIEGKDLAVYGRKLRLRPAQERIRETRRIGVALCEALAELHSHGLVHRDVKPSNVLLDRAGEVHLADLGVLRDLNDPSTNVEGRLIGTAAYAPPEQGRGDAVDHRADIYSLGCTLFFLLTARRPYPEKDRKEVIRSHRRAPIPRASALDPAVPERMDRVIARMMAKRPEDRYADARAARAALAASVPDRAPAPLAGRRRYVDLVSAALSEHGEGIVIRPVGCKGSGRGWLLEVVEELARARGLEVVVARDKKTLSLALKRTPSVVIATRLRVSEGVKSVDIRLRPLGLADLRRTVVSVATRTRHPHRVAERLYRATGGHPGWLLPLLETAKEGQLTLPDELPVPGELLEAVEDLPEDALTVLGALAVLNAPSSPQAASRASGLEAAPHLQTLRAEGLAIEEAGAWRVMGELVCDAVELAGCELGPIKTRAAALLRPRPANMDQTLKELRTLIRVGRLRQVLDEAARGLVEARATGDSKAELELLLIQSRALMDLGRAREAQVHLADASALAHALDLPLRRRASHVLRAQASMSVGGLAASSAALDRLHRAISRVKVKEDPGWRGLALALRARLAAERGDSRSYERALEAQGPITSNILRLRADLELARAAKALGDSTEALRIADATRVEAQQRGWPAIADAAATIALQAQ